MKAVRIHEYGGREKLIIEEVPVPEIADDEILVKVHAASVNPVDYKVREGKLKWRNLHQLPLILGWDVSGKVEKNGINVTQFKPGDEVYSRPSIARDGTYAEFIAIKADEAAFKPKTITHEEAASIPLVGLTAWESLVTTAKIQPDQKVLIHAASGGVGSFAVQLAKIFGCHVTGTTSGKNVDFVRSLGADEVVDYNLHDFSTILKDMDVVLDSLGGEIQDKSIQVLKEGGIIVSIINPQIKMMVRDPRIRTGYIFVKSDEKTLVQLAHLIDRGKIKPVVTHVLPLDEIRKAHELIESGHTAGKIVLKIW